MRIYRIRKFPARLFILILAITIIAFNPKIRHGLKSFAFEILAKPIKFLSGIKEYFASAKKLYGENLLLKQRNAALSVTLARMKEMSSENERLEALLRFKKDSAHTCFAAKVIARDLADWRRAVIINKGKRDGVREGMPCATAKGLIGRVVEAGPASSKVMLITDPDSRVGVILESSRESGVLTGGGEGICRIIYLSLDGEVERGDAVLTAGFSAFIPKGLPVGSVTSTGVEKAKLYKYAVVEPFENMNKIEEVVCIDIKR